MSEKLEKNNKRVESSIQNDIDYLELRKLYEKVGNQEKIDYIIKQYLQFCRYDSISPVLEGVTLSEESISELSIKPVITLLLNDAKPTSSLKSALFNRDNTKYFDFKFFDLLYKEGKLTIREFESILLSSTEEYVDINIRIENILRILESDTLKEYEEIDFKKMEGILLSFLKERPFSSLRNSFDRIIHAIIKILVITPHNDIHDELIKHLLDFREKIRTNYGYSTFELVNSHIEDALNAYLFRKDIHILKLLDFLSTRLDLARLSQAMTTRLEGVERTTLLDSIINGTCTHIAVAMYVFSNLWYDDKSYIINEWAKSERVLELDIYLSRFLDDSQTLSLEEALELDAQYKTAMELEAKKKDI